MRVFRFALSAAALISSTGCASYFLRKECEKTNWYQHGHNVAMSGKRLDADDFVKRCQDVEAKISFTQLDTGFKSGMATYCTGDNVFAVGKAGKPFSYDMCDGENLKKMKARYLQGLALFCTPANAYRFGSGGGVYLNVCSGKDEESFLPEYRRGRKVFLAAVIEEKEREVRRLDVEISRLQSRRAMLTTQQIGLNGRTTIKREQVWDAARGTFREQVTQVPDENAKQEHQRLQHEISGVDYEINRTRKQQDDLTAEVGKMRTEMVAL